MSKWRESGQDFCVFRVGNIFIAVFCAAQQSIVKLSTVSSCTLYVENKCSEKEDSLGPKLYGFERSDGMPERAASFCGFTFGNICKNFPNIEEL